VTWQVIGVDLIATLHVRNPIHHEVDAGG